MPELPEVETVRRGLAPVMEGRKITRVILRRSDLRKPFPKGFQKRIEGARVKTVARRAKYLLLHLDTGDVVIWHLGMSGQVRIYAKGEAVPKPQKHDHVEFHLQHGATIRFTDPRRFGLMDLGFEDTLDQHALLKDIGPEPLSNHFSAPVLQARLSGKRIAIKQALMDARVVAGVGNIYASEALYRAAISPKRSAASIGPKRAAALVGAIVGVLSAAIRAGGSTLKDHRTTDGELGYFQHSFAVYGRTGEACPDCDCNVAKTGGIKNIVQGGRATFYCPRRQR